MKLHFADFGFSPRAELRFADFGLSSRAKLRFVDFGLSPLANFLFAGIPLASLYFAAFASICSFIWSSICFFKIQLNNGERFGGFKMGSALMA